MKKIFALLFALVASFGLLTSCDFGSKTEEQPTEPAISQELQNAKNYIKNIYQSSEGNVTANLERAAKLPIGGKEYTVTWAVEVTSGDANAVSVAKAEDGSKWVVSVKYDQTITAEVKFVLTATITSPEGESTTQAFNYTIPAFEAHTIAQMISEGDKEKIYFLEGVITTVNKDEGKTSFIITDATGSIFCYDGLEVKLGQKVQITGNYSAYNDAFHQLAKPELVKVLAENQDLTTVCGTPLETTAEAINAAAKAEGATAVSLTEAYGGKYLAVTGYVVEANGYANMAVAKDAASCCNLYAADSLKLKSFIGAKVVVKGYARGVSVGNGITIQVQSVELAPGETMPEQPTDKFVEPAVTNKTLAEIIAMDDANNLKAAYTVTATVSKLGQKEDQTVAGAYGNLWVGEGAEKILVYGATATKTALAWDETTGKYVYTNAKDFDTNELTKDIKVGDKLQLLVVRSAYNGTPQLMVIVLAVNPEEVTYASKTVAELKAIPAENEMKEAYILTTKVAKLGQKDEQTTAGIYGNLWVGEGEDTILVYGATATASALVFDITTGVYKYTNAKDYEAIAFTNNIKVGDTVELLVVKTNYKGTAQVNAIVLKVNGTAYTPVETPEEPTPTPEVPSIDASATISFEDKANRTVFTTEQQVWVQNGITVTNDKGASTSNVADYGNPARFYKSSDLKIEYTSNVTTIVVNCNTEGYATALAASTITGGTAVANGKVVTITLTTPATNVVITGLSAQVRVDSISVVAA